MGSNTRRCFEVSQKFLSPEAIPLSNGWMFLYIYTLIDVCSESKSVSFFNWGNVEKIKVAVQGNPFELGLCPEVRTKAISLMDYE